MKLILKKESAFRFFFLFIYIDLLFFPNFIASTPLSFFVYALLSFFFLSLSVTRLFSFFLLFFILLLSVMHGAYSYNNDFIENIKRAIQLMLTVSLVFINYKYISFDKLSSCLLKVTYLFLVYCFVLSALFFYNYDFYHSFISRIYPSSLPMLESNYQNMRFSYQFTDPNSFSYLLLFLSVNILCFERSPTIKFFAMIVALYLILVTQSRGGALGFFVICIMYFFALRKAELRISTLITSIFIGVVLLYLSIDYLFYYYELLQERRQIEVDMGSTIGGGRLEIWGYFFRNLNMAPIGVGYDIGFKPHSDFIRLNLSYGFLIYFILFYYFSSFTKDNYILWVAFAFPFFVNTLIDDYRLFGVFILSYLFFLMSKKDRQELSAR